VPSSSLRDLRESVCHANQALVRAGLVTLSFGNASGVDRASGVMVIKPSGVPYDELTPQDMVVIRLETGDVAEGDLRPSSDTPTHLVLYRRFSEIGGVVHTHSTGLRPGPRRVAPSRRWERPTPTTFTARCR